MSVATIIHDNEAFVMPRFVVKKVVEQSSW
jgi:hypothetical protein